MWRITIASLVLAVSAFAQAPAAPAQAPTICGNQPLCFEASDFAATITDFRTSYEFQKGWFQGISLLFQVNNLTNTPFIDYSVTTTRTRDYETFGRDFFFGLNYKF